MRGSERDPVCGMIVDGVNARHRAEYAGDSYFFCSAGCRKKFIAEPARYRLSPLRDAGSHSAPDRAFQAPGPVSPTAVVGPQPWYRKGVPVQATSLTPQ
jgi:YHS domain-containing protein